LDGEHHIEVQIRCQNQFPSIGEWSVVSIVMGFADDIRPPCSGRVFRTTSTAKVRTAASNDRDDIAVSRRAPAAGEQTAVS
jgi:hypothetical protein